MLTCAFGMSFADPTAQAALAALGVFVAGSIALCVSSSPPKRVERKKREIKIFNELVVPIQLSILNSKNGVMTNIATIQASSNYWIDQVQARKARIPGSRIVVTVDGTSITYQLFELKASTKKIVIGRVLGTQEDVQWNASRSQIEGPSKIILANSTKMDLQVNPGGQIMSNHAVVYRGGGSHQGVPLGTVFHESIHEPFRLTENYTKVIYGIIEQF